MAIEITDDDMTDPSVAFAKLIRVVQEGQRDTKKGFSLTQQQIEQAFAKAMQAAAPDYGEELKRIKTAIQAIDGSVQDTCKNGSQAVARPVEPRS